MRKAPCADLAELRSAFVDGALDDTDRERLLSHLVDCANCRRDVEDLRAVRDVLNQTKNEPDPTPSDLSLPPGFHRRAQSVAPLWIRPFRRIQPSLVPNRRPAEPPPDCQAADHRRHDGPWSDGDRDGGNRIRRRAPSCGSW